MKPPSSRQLSGMSQSPASEVSTLQTPRLVVTVSRQGSGHESGQTAHVLLRISEQISLLLSSQTALIFWFTELATQALKASVGFTVSCHTTGKDGMEWATESPPLPSFSGRYFPGRP